MAARRIDGKAVAKLVRAEARERVEAFASQYGTCPHLVVVLASDDPASQVYVRNKTKAASEVGLRSSQHTLDPTTSPEELLDLVHRLNRDRDVDGILVQLPLPGQHDTEAVIRSINPDKDVDGLHPENAGKLARGDEDCLVPCTPRGAIRLLEEAETTISGQRAVVLGRSRLVGRPVADLLINRHATVTICHSRTRDLPDRVREADIVVAAIGREAFVEGSWLRPGATVIDVGINRNETTGKLVGDVAFEEAQNVVRAITPVPGGVGPMTVAYLLENTIQAAVSRRAQ